MHALAIDLGTTTLAASLIALPTGERLAMAGSLNPQKKFGADVVSRLQAALGPAGHQREMSTLIRSELWRLAEQLCQRAGIRPERIGAIAVAGNPAMQHLLLGLPLQSLAFPPFRPAYPHGTRMEGAALGWDTAAELYVFPMPGGFVGGDTVAFLYGQLGRQECPDPTLYLDMGTNGEMALADGNAVWATSAAAGPAFEGGNLSCGTAALPGAIDSVRIEGERVRCTTIGGLPPIGICGSAAIQAVSELLDHGLVEASGRLLGPAETGTNLGARLVEYEAETAFVLHRDARHLLLLTQGDIRQIQLAKGAIRAGIEVLCERSRIRCEAVRELVLTGSFGAVLQAKWLKTIGIFDSAMVQRTRFAPEGALAGVERALTDSDGFPAVEDLAQRMRVIPLSGTPLFEKQFLAQIDFPHT